MRKIFIIFINIFMAILFTLSISILHIELNSSNISIVLQSDSFENTPIFSNIIQDKIIDSFFLVSAKDSFESYEIINYNSLIAKSLNPDGTITNWTIYKCFQELKNHGIMLDSNYDVVNFDSVNTVPPSNTKVYNFLYKLYPSKVNHGAQTEAAFLDEFSNVISRYYKSKKFFARNNTNVLYNISFHDEATNTELKYFNTSLTESELLNSDSYIYISSVENLLTSKLPIIFDNDMMSKIIKNNPHKDMDFKAIYVINTNYSFNDILRQNYIIFHNTKLNFFKFSFLACFSLVLFVITFVKLLLFDFININLSNNNSQKFYLLIPTEFYLISYCFAISVSPIMVSKFISNTTILNYHLSKYTILFTILSIYILSLLLTIIIISKHIHNKLAPAFLDYFYDYNDNSIKQRMSFFIGILIPLIILSVFPLYTLNQISAFNNVRTIIIVFICFVSILILTVYIFYLYYILKNTITYSNKNTELRTTLIENISHDIKTPITSIINYAEIIIDNIRTPHENSSEDILRYSTALINKANRLNELTENLIFSSKINTGNVEINMQKLDLNAFIIQCIAEFDDNLKSKNLKVIYNNNSAKSAIFADSTYLYRVFQNLFSNIYKYSLENSRIYIDLNSTKNKITITLKNIQKEKIEIDINTIKNRFVRGSKSRSTEGFGLGLSIADSLIKLMNGTLEIKNIRDEFSTIITFSLYV